MKEKILDLIKNSEDEYISGQFISEKLGVSRTAIWKYINTLKEEGYEIESISKKGYKLLSSPDILTFEELKGLLNTEYIGKKIIHFHSIDSTNKQAKELATLGEKNGTVLISEEQTGGKGRLGRTWISPKGKGIWLTIILTPDMEPMDVPKITQIAAAAVCSSLREIGADAYIKWPNDIIMDSKKVCGILTEMSCELNRVNYIVLGIGINANLDNCEFNEEVKDKATSIKIQMNEKISRKILTAKVLNNFEIFYEDFLINKDLSKSLEICKKYSVVLGREIRVINRNEEYLAKAVDIDSEGRLIIKTPDGNSFPIFSGEISIRGVNGYI
ncbi:biotin--[acetyl-CoA-carboxylase] ligase [uncultured Clostridium sp.]|uniref:biotin--[acetyl-CoA-carboxylase] ligase n=1 Tax=uncultured Clostridium sp. TaxID=59620 RepID=UPI0028F11BB5|nr:biotin--[acetyl-CoA-carboxylase] ligase [uncultured Clostridium sp.]